MKPLADKGCRGAVDITRAVVSFPPPLADLSNLYLPVRACNNFAEQHAPAPLSSIQIL